MKLYSLSHLLFIVCTICGSALCVIMPRGVSLLRNVFYDPKKDFCCLDGSGVFPFYYVNDDFCDCEDGSDEPGTSACPNGIFVCLNYGHASIIIPSSKVNDGICDCCDTSDEYGSSSDCFNNCKEQGLEAIKMAIKIYQEYQKGNATRKAYISDGNSLKEGYRTHVQTFLPINVWKAMEKVIFYCVESGCQCLNNLPSAPLRSPFRQKQAYLNDLLEDESQAMKVKLNLLDLREKAEENENIYLGIQKKIKEEQERKRNKEMKLLEEQKNQEIKNAKKVFMELDRDKNNKIVMSEVQSFKQFDYDGDGKVSEQEAKFYMQMKEELTLDEFIEISWRNMKSAFMLSEFTDEGENEYAKTSESPNIVKNVPSITSKVSDEEKNAAFEDAALKRKLYADAEKKLQDIQSEIWLLKNKLESDYGHDGEFFVHHKQCFDFSDKRYLYRLCPFDKVLQITKHNQDEILLGLWNTWVGMGDIYSQMSYTKGSTCWNGPPRSVVVNLQCGLEDKVLSVTEYSPCQYLFEFATPASCKDLPNFVKKVMKEHTFYFN